MVILIKARREGKEKLIQQELGELQEKRQKRKKQKQSDSNNTEAQTRRNEEAPPSYARHFQVLVYNFKIVIVHIIDNFQCSIETMFQYILMILFLIAELKFIKIIYRKTIVDLHIRFFKRYHLYIRQTRLRISKLFNNK